MPHVTIKPVTRDDVGPLVDMEIPDHQKRFVAPNAVSLAEAHYEGGGYPFCIRANGTPVGLVQVINCPECPNLLPEDDPNSVYLWRFMIVGTHQRQGIGRRVMHWLEAWSRDRNASAITLSVTPDNEGGIAFYEACGYTRTGRIVEDELEMRLPLSAG